MTRAYKEDIGRYHNMEYRIFEDEHYYICHDGRELYHIRTENREQAFERKLWRQFGAAAGYECEKQQVDI